MKIRLLLFSFFITSFCYSQNTDSYNTSIVVIRNNIYKMHHGQHKINDSIINTSIRYTKVDLSNVLFKTTRAELLPKSYNGLNQLSKLLKENPNMNLKIEGHTDKIGDPKKNLKLSTKRARTIKFYLFNKGISLERMVATGHGDTSPICESPCIENQRVQFALINNGKSNTLSRTWDYDWDKIYVEQKN